MHITCLGQSHECYEVVLLIGYLGRLLSTSPDECNEIESVKDSYRQPGNVYVL